jgi:ArsR family transcriptional regulator
MKILCDADIVISRKEGKWTHYSISKSGCEYAEECLKALTDPSLSNNR